MLVRDVPGHRQHMYYVALGRERGLHAERSSLKEEFASFLVQLEKMTALEDSFTFIL